MNIIKVSGPAGVYILVKLSYQATVYLVDWSNLQSLKGYGQFRGFGGLYAKSPILFTKPDDGDWYVVVHNPYGGRVKFEVSVA